MSINVIQYDDRLWYLRSFYNEAFSIASKHEFDDQFVLLATVYFRNVCSLVITIETLVSSYFCRGTSYAILTIVDVKVPTIGIGNIKSGTSNFCQFWKVRCSSSFIVILPLIIEIWHYSSWQFKNLFYTHIFLFQMPSSFDKGRFWLGLH
jgi:hypothetical protein